MAQKITYWITTVLAALAALSAVSYLFTKQAVEGFNHLGYPQQLRIILGIAKPLAGITILVPGLVRFKEWAYAGFGFALICALVAHYLAGDGARAFSPLIALTLLIVSYFTRPANRQWPARAAA